MLFWADYYLRWWRLPIEERACRTTDLGGGDNYLRNSGLPPSPRKLLHYLLSRKLNSFYSLGNSYSNYSPVTNYNYSQETNYLLSSN